MEIKVREVNEVESKSTQQVEQELLEKHEAEVSGETSLAACRRTTCVRF
jgi:hypothetical protein